MMPFIILKKVQFIKRRHSGSQRNNKKRSHTQLDSRKQAIAFQDRVITVNIKEAQHPLKEAELSVKFESLRIFTLY